MASEPPCPEASLRTAARRLSSRHAAGATDPPSDPHGDQQHHNGCGHVGRMLPRHQAVRCKRSEPCYDVESRDIAFEPRALHRRQKTCAGAREVIVVRNGLRTSLTASNALVLAVVLIENGFVRETVMSRVSLNTELGFEQTVVALYRGARRLCEAAAAGTAAIGLPSRRVARLELVAVALGAGVDNRRLGVRPSAGDGGRRLCLAERQDFLGWRAHSSNRQADTATGQHAIPLYQRCALREIAAKSGFDAPPSRPKSQRARCRVSTARKRTQGPRPSTGPVRDTPALSNPTS